MTTLELFSNCSVNFVRVVEPLLLVLRALGGLFPKPLVTTVRKP